MKFVLLGRYDFSKASEVAERDQEVFRRLPRGLEVIKRYSAVGKNLAITVIETDDARNIAALLLMFEGLVKFEVIPVFEVKEKEAIDLTRQYRETEMPMHGPI